MLSFKPSSAIRIYVTLTADINVAGIAAIKLDNGFLLNLARYVAPAQSAIIAKV